MLGEGRDGWMVGWMSVEGLMSCRSNASILWTRKLERT